MRVRLLLNEETEVLSSSAERLRFEMAEMIAELEEGRSGVDGRESSSLDTGLSLCTGALFVGRVGGPIMISPPVVTTV